MAHANQYTKGGIKKGKKKGAPKLGKDPLAAITAQRKGAEKHSRKPTKTGTFHQGPKSSTSSN